MIKRRADATPGGWARVFSKFCVRVAAGLCVLVACLSASAADLTFNVALQGSNDPLTGTSRYGDVWGEGDYAYMGSYMTTGVRIFNIADPTNPVLVSTYQGGVFKDVKTRNGIGYFASDDNQGMHIVDLSDPANPVLIKKTTSQQGGFNDIHNIFLDGDYVYQVNNSNAAVKVLDISDPANPVFVRNIILDTPGEGVHDITVRDGRLYTSSKGSSTSSGGTTSIYDITNVGTVDPPLLKAFTTGPRTHSNWSSVDGNTLVVGQEREGGQLRIYDISNIDQPNDPDNPVLLKTIAGSTLSINARSPHNPVIVGDKLFVSWYQAGLLIFDLSDPSAAPLVGAYDTLAGQPGNLQGNWGVFPFLGSDRVLLSDTEGGLMVVDVSGIYTAGPIEGDFDFDGFVGISDLNIVLAKWNLSVIPGDESQGDASNDGFVGIEDINTVLGNWNAGTPPGGEALSNVPEPGAAVLFGAGFLGVFRCGVRRGAC
jgi:choice-of-anchor B domain-containing protein